MATKPQTDGTAETIRRANIRLNGLETERAPMDGIMRDIRDFLAPRTARFSGEKVNNGTREDSKIINGRGRIARRILRSGLMSGFTSKTRPWFRLETADAEMMEYFPVKTWLYLVENEMRSTLLRSNFYAALGHAYGQVGDYGTAPLTMQEDDTNTVRFASYPWGAYYIAQDERYAVDTLYRRVKLTVSQLVALANQRGGKVSESVKTAYERGNYDEWRDCIHVVEPNYSRNPGSMLARDKRWRSLIYEFGQNDRVIEQGGFDFNPVPCLRWELNGEDTYAVGCGEMALGDSRALQLLERRKYQGLDMLMRPPMVGAGLNEQGRNSAMPGETIYVSGFLGNGKPYYPAYEINPRLDHVANEIRTVEYRINECYFVPLFQIISNLGDQPNITATQISAMKDEAMLQLAPVGDNIQAALDTVIKNLFQILLFKGRIPPPPEEMGDMPVKIEYISLMAQAQRAMGIGALERITGFVSTVAAVYPQVLDKVDFDQAVDEYAMMSGQPPRLVRPDEAVEKMRGDRAQQQQQQMALAAAPQLAGAVRDLANSPVGSDSLLSRAAGISA